MTDLEFTLNTGAKIPALGLGTWQSAPGAVRIAVEHALLNGYRHIDAAWCYGNEDEVGQGLKRAFAKGIKRKDVFVTTKLWCTYHENVEANLDESLKSLELDYVDMYLMHWPVAMNPNGSDPRFPMLADGTRDILKDRSHVDTYLEMEQLLKTGKVKAIGVANYSVKYLEDLLQRASVVPAVNQIENHPQCPQQDIVDYCRQKGIHVTAYSPLGSSGSPLMSFPDVVEVADKYGVSPACVLLSYHVQRGSSVLAKSVNPTRITTNRHLIKLDAADMEALMKIGVEYPKRYVLRDWGVSLGFPDM